MSSFLSNLPGYRTKPVVRAATAVSGGDGDGGSLGRTQPDSGPENEAFGKPGISVVIVSYNVREYLDACLQSIYHASETFAGAIEIIVFDNDSRDGTLTLLKPRYPEVIWLKSDRNLGFGTGCNRGAALSTQDLLLFLNPDTLVNENTFQVMWDFFRTQKHIGVAGCKILNRDGSLQLACKRSFPSPQVAAFKLAGLSGLFPKSRVFGRYNLTFLDENKTHEVDAVSGSFMCVKTDLFRTVGGFDEDFFMYGEDLDICFRIKLLGKRNFYHPQTTAIHFKGESAKSKPFRSFLYFYEAMVIFSRKHFELRALPLVLFYFGVTVLAMANFGYSRFQKWQRWTADLFLVNAILALVTYTYMQHFLSMSSPYLTDRRLYLFWHCLVSAAVLLPMAYTGDYGRSVLKMRTVFSTLCVSFLGFFALSFFIREEAYSRVAFALAALFSIASLISWRYLTLQGGIFFSKIMGSTKRIAILGNNARARKLADMIQQERLNGYEFVGFIRLGEGSVSQDIMQNMIGDLSTLPSIVKKVELQGVIIAVEEGAFQTAVKLLSEKSSHDLEIRLLVGEPEPGAISLIELNFGK